MLHEVAKKGMYTRENKGGPTILDINTGFIRDSLGLENLFSRNRGGGDIYTSEDFESYSIVIQKLKAAVTEHFDARDLHFTSPTFITRIDATTSWSAREEHDEYWHVHADR